MFNDNHREMLREEVRRQTELGNRVVKFMQAGALVPDDLVQKIVAEKYSLVSSSNKDGVIMDGYPRTVAQAEQFTHFLQSSATCSMKAVNITLQRRVIMEKLLGRRICRRCNGNFNVASVMDNGFDMPAILPDPITCPLGAQACNPDLYGREDDIPEVIERRLKEHDLAITTLLEFYQQRGILYEFEVKKGIKETDALLKLMLS